MQTKNYPFPPPTGPVKTKDFYVYAHIKRTTGEVFYIGKGLNKRAWSSSKRGGAWEKTANKHGWSVRIIQDGLQEWAAFELECQMIALYGRRDCGYGSLVNMTDGGDMGPRKIFTDEEKARWVTLSKSAYQRPDVKERHRAAINTKEYKEKHRSGILAVTSSKKYRENMKRVCGGSEYRENQRQKSNDLWKLKEYRAKHLASLNTAEVKEKKNASNKKLWANSEYRELRSVSLRKNAAAMARPVVCIEESKMFNSVTEAVAWLAKAGFAKAAKCAVCNACSGKSKSAYTFTWAYLSSFSPAQIAEYQRKRIEQAQEALV